jgi:hypothetical protein
MRKRDVCRLKPGTWIELAWIDANPTVALLLEKPESEPGDVSLYCFYPESGYSDRHAVHTQVVAVHGAVQVPKATTSGYLLPK